MIVPIILLVAKFDVKLYHGMIKFMTQQIWLFLFLNFFDQFKENITFKKIELS